MKNLFKVLIVAVATTVLFACDKETENPNSETPVAVRTVQFSAGPITKTVFGTLDGSTLPTLWTENKTVGISLNFATAKQSTTPEVAGVGTTANFQADIEDSGSAPYTFYAVSPYSSLISVNSNYKSAKINIPTSQTPLATSVDESAQILVAKNNVGDSFPSTSVTMAFEHLTAYGKISFKNLTLADGEAVASITLTAAENWAGQYYYYFEDNDNGNNYGDFVATSASKTITISTSNSSNIWFACAPVDLRGEDVDVVITTNQGTTYSKTITIPTDATGDKHLFKSGKVNAFTINMEGITADGAVDYVLVKNAADLTVGSEVVIAAYGNVNYAISTTQNTNNWAATAVTKSQDLSTISSPSVSIQRFTLAAGNQSGTIAFSFPKNDGTSYLCAQSGASNYMKDEAALSDYGSWNVSIESETGEATITAYSGTNNHMRYNPNNDKPIFSCYASTSSVSTKVAIYLYDPTTWNLSSIAVTTPPTKTEYEAGEDFDATGMVVSAHYVDAADNTHTKDVIIDNSSLTISPSTNLTAGTTSVSISFAGQSTTQDITVTAPITWDLKSIAVTTAPGKTTYTAGETFDPAGMVVTATYENHDNTEQTKQEVVDNGDLTFSPTTSTPLTTSDESVSITYGGKSTNQAITVTKPGLIDVLTSDWAGTTSGSSYGNWSGKNGSSSDAVYAGNSNKGVAFIQLRNTNLSGIVSTTSGGILKSISVKWNSNTLDSRTLSVYTKNTAYSGPADLYGNDTKGTLVHTFAKTDGDASWTFDSGYEYIGLLASGALYLDEIDIEWQPVTWNLSSIEVTNEPEKTAYEAGENFNPTGIEVTAHYVDADDNTHIKDVILDNDDLEINPSTNLTAGTTSVTISYGGQNTSQAITVSAAKVWDLKSIAVKTAPDKTTYTEGDFFDPAGLVITPTFENRNNTAETKTGDDVAYSNETAASFAFSPTTSKALETSNTSVSISYTASGITKSTTQAITVNAAPTGTPGDETFDLTKKTYTTGTNLVTWTGESVVIINSGTNATNYLGGDANSRTSSRFYTGNNLVINPNSDYTITSIVFTATSTNYASTLGNSSWSNGSASVSGSTVTVTPDNGSTSVTATVGGTCGFTSIVVNYLYSGTPAQKYAITIASGIANGSVSADLSEAAEGVTVTLTATPSSGYVLDAWDVYKTGESGTKVTVTNNTFTMPAYPVTVSASFTTSGGGGGGDTPVTVSMNSFSELSGYVDGDTNVSYAATKGASATAPAVNSNEIRIYQNGGLLTITANNGKTITNVTIGSSMVTKVQVNIDNGGFGSDNDISKGGTYSTGTISASSTVVFKCTGTDKNSRLYLNYLSVTYE